jgi:hypothetical protein
MASTGIAGYENMLSYDNIVRDMKLFKEAGTGTYSFDEFNFFDTPAQRYFKILFYFGSAPEQSDIEYPSGLLAPTWEYDNLGLTDEVYMTQTNEESASARGRQMWEAMSEEERKAYADKQNQEIAWQNSRIKDKNHHKPPFDPETQWAEKSYSNTHFDIYNHNSAWAYLKLNDEQERAEKLEQFILLLSNISSKSPWYFSSVGGVSEALERKVTEDGKLDMTERRKITITCMPDAFDNRIGTLLDLYRDITWSWANKKEIIPANLRKFDMAIYIFEAPERIWHNGATVGRVSNPGEKTFDVGYKMIEFHDCEFNYNSVKSGWEELNNQNGSAPTYKIEIFYNDCYEVEYNDLMARTIGDIILTDLIDTTSATVDSDVVSVPQYTRNEISTLLDERLNQNFYEPIKPELSDKEKRLEELVKKGKYYKRIGNLNNRITHIQTEVEYERIPQPGFLTNAVGQIAGAFVSDVKSKIKGIVLGNLFTYSLTKIGRDVSSLLKGDVIKTGMTVKQYVDAEKDRKSRGDDKTLGEFIVSPVKDIPWSNQWNYFDSKNEDSHKEVGPNMFMSGVNNTNNTTTTKGNIFSNSTLANNI